MAGEGLEALSLPLHPALLISSIRPSWLNPFKIKWRSSQYDAYMRSVSCSSKLIQSKDRVRAFPGRDSSAGAKSSIPGGGTKTPRKGSWDSPICSHWVRSPGHSADL